MCDELYSCFTVRITQESSPPQKKRNHASSLFRMWLFQNTMFISFCPTMTLPTLKTETASALGQHLWFRASTGKDVPSLMNSLIGQQDTYAYFGSDRQVRKMEADIKIEAFMQPAHYPGQYIQRKAYPSFRCLCDKFRERNHPNVTLHPHLCCSSFTPNCCSMIRQLFCKLSNSLFGVTWRAVHSSIQKVQIFRLQIQRLHSIAVVTREVCLLCERAQLFRHQNVCGTA